MQHSRQALGDRWAPTCLSSPIWRFALASGACGEHAWLGLMIPSVDRVGRHFPLTLAAVIDSQESLLGCASPHDEWFQDIEELALSSLADGFSLEDFDTALCNLGPPNSACGTAVAGRSHWWTEGSQQIPPCILVCNGLPTAPRLSPC